MKLKATVRGRDRLVEKENMQEAVIMYYDATGIKHFYLDVEEMNDEELIALYENSFAREE